MSPKRANRKTLKNANPPPAGSPLNAPGPALPVPAKRRRWIFRLASLILAPLLFLALLEFGLQLGGYGHAAGFFIKTDSLGEFRSNPNFGLRFFPRGLARDPVKLILNAKSPDTLRIFVLGDSAAQGTPSPTYSFGRILEVMLRDRYPDSTFEVVNAAMTAINSHVTLEIARDCLAHQPDLFVVYMGNNEVVGPYGPGTVFQKWNPSLFLIRSNLEVKSTRTGQLLENIMHSLRPGERPPIWGGMEMFLGNTVTAEDPRLAAVYDNFRHNLADICGVAARARAPVILSTMAVNLRDCPPFASHHRAGISDAELKKWESEYRAGIALENSRQWQAALAKYESAARLDDRFAELQFRIGRCLAAEGRLKEARLSFVAARDLDTLRFRADTQINRAIRDFAAQKPEGVYLADAEQSFAAGDSAADSIPGKELFYEHVHFTFDGSYALALTVLDQVEKALPQLSRLRKTDSVPAKQQCKQALALTVRDEYYLMTQMKEMIYRRPFSGQLDHAVRLKELREQESNLGRLSSTREAFQEARRIYEAALQKAPDDWVLRRHYGKVLIDAGDLRLASDQLHSALKKYPWDSSLYLNLGYIEIQNGRNEEAAAFFRKALELSPDDLHALSELGRALTNLDRLDEATEQFKKVLEMDPEFDSAHVYLAVALTKQGRAEDVITHFRKAAAANPQNSKFRSYLGLALTTLGRIDEAINSYKKALEIEPDFEAAHMYLGDLLVRQGRREEAIPHFRRAMEINPGNAQACYKLGLLLAVSGRIDAAMAQFGKTLEIDPNYEDARIRLGVLLAQRGRIAEAIAQFRKTVQINPGNAIAHFTLGRLLAASGQPGEAADCYRRALEINPNFAEARKELESITSR